MENTIRFSSAIDQKTVSLSGAQIPLTETDELIVTDIDVQAIAGGNMGQNEVASVGGNTQGTLYMDVTMGSLTSIVIKPYGSYKGLPASAGDWFMETDETDSSGNLTLNQLQITITQSGRYMFHFPIGACRANKFTVAGAGATTGAVLNLAVGLRSN